MTHRAGYSLFEVLIAFAVMSLVLAVLIPGQARQLAQVKQSESRLLAQEYALSRLAEMGVSQPVSIGTRRETYGDWTIDWDVTPTTIAPLSESAFGLIRVEVLNQAGHTLFSTETMREITP